MSPAGVPGVVETVEAHGETTLVVEQDALGINTKTGVQFALPNVAVIEVNAEGFIASYRDYVNPVAVAEVLGDAAR